MYQQCDDCDTQAPGHQVEQSERTAERRVEEETVLQGFVLLVPSGRAPAAGHRHRLSCKVWAGSVGSMCGLMEREL